MITVKTKEEIKKMRRTGRVLAKLFDALDKFLRPGLTTFEIDAWIEKELEAQNLISQSKGYMGYQHVSCISLNDEVVHGVPSTGKKLMDGDLVKIDICVSYNGYCADMARMFFIGKPDEKVLHFMNTARRALDKGIAQAKSGNRLSDISAAIQKEVESQGFGVIRDFAGHGIGKKMHEEPEILNYGTAGRGPTLQAGMTLAIEPMITMGNYNVRVGKDKWTVKTVDKSLAAHVEDTIVVTDSEPIVLTRLSQPGE